MGCKMHVINCKGLIIPVPHVFSAFTCNSTSICGSLLYLILTVQNGINQVTTNNYSPHRHDGEEIMLSIIKKAW